MNRYKILSLLSLSILVATGCSKKFLEEKKSYDKYDESIFENETQTGWYIDRMYNDYFASFKSPNASVVGVYTDDRARMTEELGGTIGKYIDPARTVVNAADAETYYGSPLTSGLQNQPYSRIRNCNFLLEKMDGLGQALSPQFRDRAKGQSYFLRALQYFELLRVYGGVPIVTTVQVASSDDPGIQLPRAKSSEVVDQIVKDLDSATRLLPLTWDAANWGRLSGAGALALKSRVLLTAASPLFNPDWDATGNAAWDKALQAGLAAETALQGGGYGLYGATAKEWGEMWYKNDNAFNKEVIITQLMSNNTAASGFINSGWERSIRTVKQGGAGGTSVPKDMIDLFPLANGARPVKGGNYVDSLFFLNRDPRFYRTFAFSGLKWGTKENANDTVFLYRWKNGANPLYSDNASTSSPVIVSKMSNPAASTATMTYSGTDIYEYRYAELLLNIAECYAAKGDINNCIVYLGKIRNRVGIPAANNWGIGTLADKYAAIEACLYERRVELAYEGKRFWDMQRWALYADDATFGNTVSKLRVTALNGTSRTGYYWQYKTTATAADPLAVQRRAVFVDPDGTNFTAQLETLKTFFQTNFNVTQLDQPMDRNSSNVAVSILFRPNYYLSGIPANVLVLNPWLAQTNGWNDYNGAPGTYNFRQ